MPAWWTHYSSKMGIFALLPPKQPSFPKPLTAGMNRHQRPPSEFTQNIIWFFYRQIKTNRKIACYRYYCWCKLNRSLRLLSLLVFTVTAFEISLFQGPERQYERSEKVQVTKITQGLDSNTQNPQLNDSFVSLALLRSLHSTKNSEPFSKSYFAPWVIIFQF